MESSSSRSTAKLRPSRVLLVESHFSCRSSAHTPQRRPCKTHFCSNGVSVIMVLSTGGSWDPCAYLPELNEAVELELVVNRSMRIFTSFAPSGFGSALWRWLVGSVWSCGGARER